MKKIFVILPSAFCCAITVFFTGLLCSCNKSVDSVDATTSAEEPSTKVVEFEEKEKNGVVELGNQTIDIYQKNLEKLGYTSVSFEETDDLCAENEGMGWVILEEPLLGGLPSVGYRGTFPEVKSISLSTAWSCFEIEPGVYDWHVMDETIAYWAQFDKEFNMRLCTDNLVLNQGVKWGAPKWLTEEPYNVPYKKLADDAIYFDQSNETYLERLGLFLEAFAAHYQDPEYPYRDLIKVVEVRGYGMVGEWHSGWNEYVDLEQRESVLRNILRMWREAWDDDKLLVVSCTYEFTQYMGLGLTKPSDMQEFCEFMGYDYALGNGITFRRDGIAFALQEYDQDFAVYYYYLNTGLPLLGEIGDGYWLHSDSSPYPVFEAINEALYKWRINYNTVIGWVAQDFEEVVIKEEPIIDYYGHTIGYRFIPSSVEYSNSVKAGDKLYVNTYIENDGVGRCWEDHDFSIYLEDANGNVVYTGTDASFNPVSMNGGEAHYFNLKFDLPETLKNGEYTIKFAISDSQGNPKIAMPIAGNDGTYKYYLGKVTVGDVAAVDLNKIDTLTKGETNIVAKGNGAITARATTVDGSAALIGSGSDIFGEGQELENGKAYYVSYFYKTNKDQNDITILDDSRYVVGAYTKDGDSWGDKYEWLDVSNNVSHRTVLLNVPNDGKKYNLTFACLNDADEIAIDNIQVEEAVKVDSSFRINPAYTDKNEDGSFTMLNTYVKTWGDGLQLKEELHPHTSYMITFDAKTTVEIGNGAFFYVGFTDNNVDYEEKYDAIKAFDKLRIGSFYTPHEYGYQKYSYTFNTGDFNAEDYYLAFGIYGIGGVQIKNITLTMLDTDLSYTTDDIVVKHNQKTDKHIELEVGDTIYENFEAGFFNGGIMYPGIKSTGIMTSDPNLVISGKYSAYIDNSVETAPDGLTYNYNIFLNSNTKDFHLECGESYRVEFKVRVVKDFTQTYTEVDPWGAYFYFIAREEGTYAHDRGYFGMSHAPNRINEAQILSDYEVGKVYCLETEFTTVSSNSIVTLQFGVGKDGAVVIDDIVITRIDNSEVNVHFGYCEPTFPEDKLDDILYDYVFEVED